MAILRIATNFGANFRSHPEDNNTQEGPANASQVQHKHNLATLGSKCSSFTNQQPRSQVERNKISENSFVVFYCHRVDVFCMAAQEKLMLFSDLLTIIGRIPTENLI
uniref:Uncharacterized protein n=1 Tax=Sphaerodactylus townsendi TaxID=933632 RepID=A0ACB8FL22_9SAUR